LGAFLAQVERAETVGLTRATHRQLILDAAEPNALLARMRSFRPSATLTKWAEPVRR
jgi:hypothetical protein